MEFSGGVPILNKKIKVDLMEEMILHINLQAGWCLECSRNSKEARLMGLSRECKLLQAQAYVGTQKYLLKNSRPHYIWSKLCNLSFISHCPINFLLVKFIFPLFLQTIHVYFYLCAFVHSSCTTFCTLFLVAKILSFAKVYDMGHPSLEMFFLNLFTRFFFSFSQCHTFRPLSIFCLVSFLYYIIYVTLFLQSTCFRKSKITCDTSSILAFTMFMSDQALVTQS